MPNISHELEDAKLAYKVRGIRISRLSLKPFFAAMVAAIMDTMRRQEVSRSSNRVLTESTTARQRLDGSKGEEKSTDTARLPPPKIAAK